MSTVLLIAQHELRAALKSARALWLSGAYLGSALLGGLAYVLSVRTLEEKALGAMGTQDPLAAATALSLVRDEAYRKAVAFFSGVEAHDIAPVLIDSVVLPAFLWASLVFLPFLVVLTSFDHVTIDLSSRAMCYPATRTSRRAILAGKLLAQLLLFTALSVVASVVLVALAFALLRSFPLAEALLGLPRVWVVLVPYGACYLGLATFASTSARQPMAALLLALGLMIGLRICGWLAEVDGEPWRSLAHLSPARYHEYLWRADLTAVTHGVLAYVAFFAVFVLLALRRLEGRNL